MRFNGQTAPLERGPFIPLYHFSSKYWFQLFFIMKKTKGEAKEKTESSDVEHEEFKIQPATETPKIDTSK
jgi:hypothetical protein